MNEDYRAVVLPHPAAELRPNSRVHWSAKARAARRARRVAKLSTLQVLRRPLAPPKPAAGACVRYSLLWWYKGTMPDADNCLASCKAYLDGIADALGVNDRTMECVGISRVHDKFAAGSVSIRLSW